MILGDLDTYLIKFGVTTLKPENEYMNTMSHII